MVYTEVAMSLGPEWKYHITIFEPEWGPVQQWCETYIGEFDKQWYKLGIDPILWINGDTRSIWFFKEEQHLIWFKIRWA